MKVTNSFQPFLSFLGQAKQYNNNTPGAIGPHAITERWSYTVPSGKISFIVSLWCRINRVTAAAPAARIRAPVFANFTFPLLQPTIYLNGVGDGQYAQLTTEQSFLAGERLSFSTEDLSTGGTVDYQAAMINNEIDI